MVQRGVSDATILVSKDMILLVGRKQVVAGWSGVGLKEGRLPKVLRFSIVDINSSVSGNGLTW